MIAWILAALADSMEIPAAAGESVLGTIKIAVMPIAKVFTMCFLGFLMASKYVNILPPSGRKLLNGLVFSLLLPCLIFSQLGQAVTLHKMLQWWFIPVNVVLGTISGSIIGFIVATIIRPPYPYFKFTIIQIGVTLAMCLLFYLRLFVGIPPTLSVTPENVALMALLIYPLANGDKVSWLSTFSVLMKRSSMYENSSRIETILFRILRLPMYYSSSVFMDVGAIILYTYVYQMFAPPPEGFDAEEENLPSKNLTVDATQEQVPLLTQNSPKDISPAQVLLPVQSTKPRGRGDSRKSKVTHIFVFLCEKLKLKQIVQPAIVASILAMILGAIPFTKKLIFTNGAPLFFFTDSCMILGDAMIPCILLALGGNLINGPGSSKLGFKTTAAIIFGRLVLVPPVGLGIVTLADKLGFLPAEDKMFRFVLLLQHTMPTSVLSGAVANLRGCGRESAAVLFWVHIFAIFSMAGWMVLYINMLF